MNQKLLYGSIPMLILSVLRNKDMYGYEIIQTLELRAENHFSLKEGTLYPLLHKMEKSKFIKSYTELDGRRQRKYYKITNTGMKELETSKKEWETYTSLVSGIIKYAQNI